jgi:rhodanese-related sulfurtransferase
LLVVQAGVPGGEFLLAITGVVVTVSVFFHGASATPLSNLYGRAVEADTLEEERESGVGGIFEGSAAETIRIKPEQLSEMLKSDDPPIVLDVRTRSQYEKDKTQIPGSIRVMPDQVEEWAQRPGEGTREPGRRPAHRRLLYLTGRSDQRPGGAAAEQDGLPGIGLGRRLRCLEGKASRGTRGVRADGQVATRRA